MFNTPLVAGGIVILTLGIPEVPTWVKIVVGIVMIVAGALVK